MTPPELKDIIDDLVCEAELSKRIAKGRALHLVLCRLLQRTADADSTTPRPEAA